MADYLLFQKAQGKSFSMNSAKRRRMTRQGLLALLCQNRRFEFQKTQSAFHPRAQRSVARRPDAPRHGDHLRFRWGSQQRKCNPGQSGRYFDTLGAPNAPLGLARACHGVSNYQFYVFTTVNRQKS